jgi:hypothetical protein
VTTLVTVGLDTIHDSFVERFRGEAEARREPFLEGLGASQRRAW